MAVRINSIEDLEQAARDRKQVYEQVSENRYPAAIALRFQASRLLGLISRGLFIYEKGTRNKNISTCIDCGARCKGQRCRPCHLKIQPDIARRSTILREERRRFRSY